MVSVVARRTYANTVLTLCAQVLDPQKLGALRLAFVGCGHRLIGCIETLPRIGYHVEFDRCIC